MTEVGLAALSDDVSTIVDTPAARQASMTFCGHVRLGRLERVVLAGLDVLQRGAVEDHVDALAGTQQASPIADVADEEANVVATVAVTLVELLGLVAPQDADDLGSMPSKWSTRRATVPEPPVTSTRRPWRYVVTLLDDPPGRGAYGP